MYIYICICYFLIWRFVDEYVKAHPLPPHDDWWPGVQIPVFGPSRLGLGSQSLSLGTPSPGLWSPSLG